MLDQLTLDDHALLLDALDELYPPAHVNVPQRVRTLRAYLALSAAQVAAVPGGVVRSALGNSPNSER